MAEINKEEAALLRQTPSLRLLRNIVVPRVSSNWKTIGLNLDIRDCRLSAIEKSEHYKTDACCTEMFSNWLNLAPHTGSLPLTWGSVLSAIEKMERVTSEELLAELKGSMESPLFREPTHEATQKLAGELKAYYNKLDPVVGDNYSPKVHFMELATVERQKYGFKKKKNLEEFLHATVFGIDEIYQKSDRVQYCQILTLHDGSAAGKHIIISGAPGSGKTTLVRQLCKDLSSGNLPNDYTLVVLVELRELIVSLQGNKEAQLHHFFRKFKRRVDISQVCSELEESNGRGTLLVLDGFDELDVRMRKCQLLMELLSIEFNYLPECDILVTSRPVTCPDLLSLMQPLHRHIEILGFSEDCIASFIRSYFKLLFQPLSQPTALTILQASKPSHPDTPEAYRQASDVSAEGGCEADRLLSRLDQLPQVKGMCRTPVVLRIVCKVCHLLGSDSLPATMSGIYEKFICHHLLANGPAGAKTSSILNVPSRDYPFFSDLCRIAFECCIDQKLIISEEDISETTLPVVRGSIYGLLDSYPVEDLSVYQELMLYHFMHKTVQESLAACHVAMLPHSVSHLKVWRQCFGRSEMAEVWKFYCGFTKLKHIDISSVMQLDKASQDIRTLLVVSLFEADNIKLVNVKIPHIFPGEMEVSLSTPYETAAYAFALQHHTSLESLSLSWTELQGANVNLRALLDALLCHPTAKQLSVIIFHLFTIEAKDLQDLCEFLSGKHQLTKVSLVGIPIRVMAAALSTESSTLKELDCIYTMNEAPDQESQSLLADSLSSTSLRHINVTGSGEMLLPILRGFAANTSTVDRTVMNVMFSLSLPLPSHLPEVRQFLVPCVSCRLSVSLPVGVWGTLLSGVEAARQLEQLRVCMHGKPEEAGPEWDQIDLTILEEVERSWALSSCRTVAFDLSSSEVSSSPSVYSTTVDNVQGCTLDATMHLLSAVVRGIMERKDLFVFELQVNDEQVSMLDGLEEIVRRKCAITVKKRKLEQKTVTVLELKPLHVAYSVDCA